MSKPTAGTPLKDLDVTVHVRIYPWLEDMWSDAEITPQLVAILADCSQLSKRQGAFNWPKVDYYQASRTMEKHGDNVLQYLGEVCGEIPAPRRDLTELGWSGLAHHYLSTAVEKWAKDAAVTLWPRASDRIQAVYGPKAISNLGVK